MSMFCYQCQEAAGGKGCSVRGVCGKTSDVANLQDLLIYTVKGVAYVNQLARGANVNNKKADKFIIDGLFTTITNANFDKAVIENKIKDGLNEGDKVIIQGQNLINEDTKIRIADTE